MRYTLPSLVAAFAIALPALASAADDMAKGDLVDAKGETIGTVTLTDGPNGVILAVEATGLPAGPHGIHIHSVGTCEDASGGFKASKGHVNPGEAAHGLLNPDGPDSGDLPNLIAHEDGTATAEFFSDRIALSDVEGRANLADGDGSAVVIHEARDDQMSQPIGGAGARIACAVISAGM
ncbi:superoxide dismutase family protein [Kaustia mangrovi]|uniref:Superoxide dismutase [Cu-Zn] n=1 Tax=Kaustia mangrovi TaxID=2593653 RepID=A0A7S8C6X3_9HYPH|nr:superoxide dismutase family protein [Kaustia mangrovi]QPC44538.1 superoxide dismutase family protein [Kaustia mangrovi]